MVAGALVVVGLVVVGAGAGASVVGAGASVVGAGAVAGSAPTLTTGDDVTAGADEGAALLLAGALQRLALRLRGATWTTG